MTPVLGKSVIGQPGVGCTQTFMTIGSFDTELEARNCDVYINTKFVKCLLSTLKVTQHNPPATWKNVPVQNFTADGDIDWTLPIQLVDAQLYRKYGFGREEIAFAESHIRYGGNYVQPTDSAEIPTDAVKVWLEYWRMIYF